MIGRLSRCMCDYSAPEGKPADCCSWSWWAASLIQIRRATEEPVSWHRSIDEPTGKELKGLRHRPHTKKVTDHESDIRPMEMPFSYRRATRPRSDQCFEVLIPSQDQDQGRTRPSQPYTAWHLQTIVTPRRHLKTLLHLFFLLPFMLYLCMCAASNVLTK